MQETTKVNYVQYGKSTKNKKSKKSTQCGTSGGSYKGDRGHGTSSKPSGQGRKFPFHKTLVTDVGKAGTRKTKIAKF